MIIFQIGQCGIQVGQSLLHPDNNNGNNQFKSLLLDTEQKVWKKRIRSDSNSIHIDQGQSGRANNWAFGYYTNVDDIMDAYRHVVESSFKYDGCMIIHSLAGGTGSGLGSRVAEEIREEYGKSALISASFAPFQTGETAVQNYNSLLSLAALSRSVDCIAYFPNDLLLSVVTKSSSLASHSSKKEAGTPYDNVVTMEALNHYASNCLSEFIIPITDVESKAVSRFKPLEFLYEMAPMPNLKYTLFASSLVTRKGERESWDDTMTALLRNVPLYDCSKRYCLSSKLVLRGTHLNDDLNTRLPKILQRWQTKLGTSITPGNISVSSYYCTFMITIAQNSNDKRRSIGTCTNSNAIIPYLETLEIGARLLYEKKAYLHWYERHCPTDVSALFEESFESIVCCQGDYKDLNLYG